MHGRVIQVSTDRESLVKDMTQQTIPDCLFSNKLRISVTTWEEFKKKSKFVFVNTSIAAKIKKEVRFCFGQFCIFKLVHFRLCSHFRGNLLEKSKNCMI